MSDNIRIGQATFFFIGLGLLLTGGVYWLKFIPVEMLYTAVFWFFILPLVALTFLALVGAVTRSEEKIFGKVGFSALMLLFYMLLDAYVLRWAFAPDSILDAAAAGALGIAVIFVSVLFAIYEETFFTAVSGFFKAGRAPDILVIILNMVIFTALHWLRYPVNLFYTLFLSISRGMLTGALLKTDNTDAPYLAHVFFNIFTSVF